MAANSAHRIFADSFAVARAIAAERGVRSGVAYFIGVRSRGFYRFLFDLHSVVYARLSDQARSTRAWLKAVARRARGWEGSVKTEMDPT